MFLPPSFCLRLQKCLALESKPQPATVHPVNGIRPSYIPLTALGRLPRVQLGQLTAIVVSLVVWSCNLTAAELPASVVSPARQGIALLMEADTLLKAGHLDAARQEFEKVTSLPGALEYQIWEARSQLKEIEGRKSGLPETDTTRIQLPPLAGVALSLHVSPQGDDSNPGTPDKPLASLEGARDRLRA